MRSTIAILAAALSTASATLVCHQDALPSGTVPDLSTVDPEQTSGSITAQVTQWSERICGFQLPHIEDPLDDNIVIFERWDDGRYAVPTNTTQCVDAYEQILMGCALDGLNGGKVTLQEVWYEAWMETGEVFKA
ncbi:unnamed protein product [Periconia digitata]|uniref:Uncharacterized protein n=1 Tax=Periconia digitata TaxID=1303443 RepID=A0A9W4UN64_9PLEO|nr:unnamed protein product [Periconia digitata]